MESNQKEIDKNLTILAKSSIVVFVGIFLSKIFTYLYRIIIARYYGPEVYGLFSLAIMVVGFFVAFSSLGLVDGVARFIPIYRAEKNESKIRYLIKMSEGILIVSGILSAIILWLFASPISINIFHNEQLVLFLKIFAILIPIQLMSNLYFANLRAYERINAYSFGLNILQNIFKLIFIGMFIFLGLNLLKSVAFSYMLGILTSLIFVYFYLRLKIPSIFSGDSILSKIERIKIKKKVLSYSWPLVLMGIGSSLMFWIDTIAIGYFKDAHWVGVYNSAIPIALLLIISQEIFMQMFFPMITRELHSKKINIARELSKQILKWIFVINIPLLVLIIIFPGVFINLFFGPDYLMASNSLRFLALGYFMYSLAGVSSNILYSYGKSKLILVNTFFVSFLNLLINFFLVPIYGIDGAAIATLISLTIFLFLTIIEGYYFSKILPLRRKLLNVVISAAIPASLLFYISNLLEANLIVLALLGIGFGFFYLFMILLTGSLDKNDLMLFSKIISRVRT